MYVWTQGVDKTCIWREHRGLTVQKQKILYGRSTHISSLDSFYFLLQVLKRKVAQSNYFLPTIIGIYQKIISYIIEISIITYLYLLYQVS